MERGARSVLDAMIRPQRLPAVGRCYRLVGLCAGVRAGKGDVAARVPVLGEDYMIESCGERVDGGDDLVAARNRQAAAGAEVVLQIDDQQRVGGLRLHHSSLARLLVVACLPSALPGIWSRKGRAFGRLVCMSKHAAVQAGSPANGLCSLGCKQAVGQARVRVRYAETDQMGVVYHANYLVWFEVGRVELMQIGAVCARWGVSRPSARRGYACVMRRPTRWAWSTTPTTWCGSRWAGWN